MDVEGEPWMTAEFISAGRGSFARHCGKPARERFMNRLVLPLAAALGFSSFSIAPPAAGIIPEAGFGVSAAMAAASEPEAIVTEIYGQWNPCCNYFNVIDTYFTPSLKKLYRDVEEGAGDDIEYAIDFDIFLNAQDEDTVTDVRMTRLEDTPGRVVVEVSYAAFGEEKTQTYTFASTADGWRIDDMGWNTDIDQLRPMLNDLKQAQRKSR
jgi:hypothetical protein